MIRRVCLVAREMEGVAGAGGVKDVVRGLADALVRMGVETTVILPRYGFIPAGEAAWEFPVDVWGTSRQVRVASWLVEGIKVLFVDDPVFSSKKDVYVHTAEDAPEPRDVGRGHRDFRTMNALHQAAAIKLLHIIGERPDIVHGHDGHCGLLPLYMKHYDAAGTVFGDSASLTTIHNAGVAYQQSMGTLDEASRLTGLPGAQLALGLHRGEVNPLLIAQVYGNINTVSPYYSRELLADTNGHSAGLGAIWKGRRVKIPGIYNGIDPELWGKSIRKFNVDDVDAKMQRRVIALNRFQNGGIPGIEIIGERLKPHRRWILFHGRLTPQKGIDAILKLDSIRSSGSGLQFIVYGRGDGEIENLIGEKCRSTECWTFLRGYDGELTRDLLAASSNLLVPSEWEPCGQIDMAGQLYGALPIVRGVGGLKKIRHLKDGFCYDAEDHHGLERMLDLALRWEEKRPQKVSRMRRCAENNVYGRRTWRKILVRGYLPLYRAIRRRHGRRVD